MTTFFIDNSSLSLAPGRATVSGVANVFWFTYTSTDDTQIAAASAICNARSERRWQDLRASWSGAMTARLSRTASPWGFKP